MHVYVLQGKDTVQASTNLVVRSETPGTVRKGPVGGQKDSGLLENRHFQSGGCLRSPGGGWSGGGGAACDAFSEDLS